MAKKRRQPKPKSDRFRVRLCDDLKNAVQESAARNRRSAAAEVNYVLTEFYFR